MRKTLAELQKKLRQGRISRREFLQLAAMLGVSTGAAACATGATPEATSAPATATSAPEVVASPTQSGAIPTGGTLRVALAEDLSSIDPHKLIGVGDLMIQGLMSQPLVAGNATDEIVPVLAERWESEDGGRVWTFHLRQGVKFHNGQEMTAEEVKWSIDRVLDPDVGAILNSVFTELGVTSTVVDKYTLQVEIESGFGAFLSHLAQSTRVAVLSPESVDSNGEMVAPIGTGPFKYVDWKPGATFTAARHDEYWQTDEDGNQLPYLDGIEITITQEATTRLNALVGEDVDFIMQPPISEVRNWVDNQPPNGVDFIRWFYNFSDYISLNTRRPPFDDPTVRQAVRYTLDREAINEALYFGLGEVHNQPFKTISRWYIEDVPVTEPDLDRANQLMEEAGLGGGVEVTMLVWTPLLEKMAEVIQAQVSQIGIRVNFDKRDVGQFFEHITTYEWDMATLIIGTIFHPDRPYGYLRSTHQSHSFVGGYDDPELDALLDDAANEPDFEKAKAMYKTVLEEYIQGQGTPNYTTNLPLVAAFRGLNNFNAYGYDLVSVNAQMGLHKSWLEE